MYGPKESTNLKVKAVAKFKEEVNAPFTIQISTQNSVFR